MLVWSTSFRANSEVHRNGFLFNAISQLDASFLTMETIDFRYQICNNWDFVFFTRFQHFLHIEYGNDKKRKTSMCPRRDADFLLLKTCPMRFVQFFARTRHKLEDRANFSRTFATSRFSETGNRLKPNVTKRLGSLYRALPMGPCFFSLQMFETLKILAKNWFTELNTKPHI